MKKKQKKQGSRIIQFVFFISIIGILILYIVDIWIPLFIVQVLKTFAYSFLAMSIFAVFLSWFFGGKGNMKGGVLIE